MITPNWMRMSTCSGIQCWQNDSIWCTRTSESFRLNFSDMTPSNNKMFSTKKQNKMLWSKRICKKEMKRWKKRKAQWLIMRNRKKGLLGVDWERLLRLKISRKREDKMKWSTSFRCLRRNGHMTSNYMWSKVILKISWLSLQI